MATDLVAPSHATTARELFERELGREDFEIEVKPDGRTRVIVPMAESEESLVRLLGRIASHSLRVELSTDVMGWRVLVIDHASRSRPILEVSVGSLGQPIVEILVDDPIEPVAIGPLRSVLSQLRASESPERREPRVRLERLGATVYEIGSNPVEELAGYPSVRDAIREHLLLPLQAEALYAEVSSLTRASAASVIPRALLFAGPPGCGKTLAARHIARSSGVPLVYAPVEGIVSKWYGEAEKRLAQVFRYAASLGRCVLFLDEIECLVGRRDAGMNEATRRVLSVLLRKLDGLLHAQAATVIGATNRPDDLDPALRSRFAVEIRFALPGDEDRAAILVQYAKQLTPTELTRLAALTGGWSGRDLKHLCDRVERAWVAALIRDGRRAAAPAIDDYERAAVSARGTA